MKIGVISGMRIVDDVRLPVRSNLSLVLRERGKLVPGGRRDGHNIWLNLGREFLARLIAYQSFSPLTPFSNDRIRYMGVGIGGTRQGSLTLANTSPLAEDYPGPNSQTDVDATVVRLERPVRISGSETSPPYLAGDVWLGQVQAPATFPVATQVTFKRLFGELEVSYGSYLVVPMSEIGLFTNGASQNISNNTALAYDSFDTLSKTTAFSLEVSWTIKF